MWSDESVEVLRDVLYNGECNVSYGINCYGGFLVDLIGEICD